MPETLKWHSIERRLPLVFGSLLILVVGGFGIFLYREVNELAVAAAEERLSRVTRQLVSAAEQGTHDRLDEAQAVAADPAVIAAARRGPTAPDAERPEQDPALAVLRRLARAITQTEAVGVLAVNGGVVLAATGPAATGGLDPAAELSLHPTSPPALDAAAATVAEEPILGRAGPLQLQDEKIYYDMWTPIRDGGTIIGHLVQRRRVDTNSTAVDLIENLVGVGSEFMYGNADGSLWTDLRSSVAPPPQELLLADGAVRYVRPGRGEWIGAAARIGRTPWMLLVEQPMSVVYGPARDTLYRLALIASALLLVGLAVAWVYSRQITGPLRDITAAAKTVAAGDYSQRVEVDRNDELGILSRAFNSMAAEVEDSREQLEEQVRLRTAKLRDTLDELAATQDELVRKERLAVLGELSSGIGHELRNPLGVMNNAVYILNQSREELPPGTARYLEVLDRQIQLAEKIIGDLLDVARVRPPERQLVSLEALVREQLQRAEIHAGIDVEIDIDPEVPPADIDPVQIGQVLLNLFSNAAQAMNDEGRLTVSARSAGNGVLQLRVADTGPGISDETRDKIFEPLFTTKARGIGLGLSVSRSLARANGGDLELLETRGPGGGAVFAVTVPAAVRELAE